jgi:hypothetical protein
MKVEDGEDHNNNSNMNDMINVDDDDDRRNHNGEREDLDSTGEVEQGEQPAMSTVSDSVVIGSTALRPLFFGNLLQNYSTDQIINIFENPLAIDSLREHPNADSFRPIPVDRIDIKRGYCFVFLKDATTQEDKERIETFAMAINGM